MPKEPTQIADYDGLGQAQLVAKGKCSPEEPMEAGIARIEERNPALNAVIHFTFDKAREQLKTQLASGKKQSALSKSMPFGGVPILYKDLMCTSAGDPHHCGSRALKSRNALAPVSSYMDLSFRKAGFMVLGRTNVPEFGMAPTTESLAYGPALNPWDTTRSPGGSSGGSAAAVAAGMVPVAHGNDAGGSIRIPASACGLVGLKPTRARISVGPEFGESGPLSHQGVMTRSVRDTAAALDILGEMYAGDPYIAPPPKRPYIEESKTSPKGLKVGFMTKVPGGQEEIHPECKVAVEKACKLVEDLGCIVTPDYPDRLNGLIPEQFGIVMNVNLANRLTYWETVLGETIPLEELEPMTAMMIDRGRGFLGTQYTQGMGALHAYSREVCSWWDEGFDILITPTLPTPPVKIGELNPEGDPKVVLPNMAKLTRYSSPINITGQPAISLPLHWTEADDTSEGSTSENSASPSLPIGVQFVAKYGRDDLLLRLAFALESNFSMPTYVP